MNDSALNSSSVSLECSVRSATAANHIHVCTAYVIARPHPSLLGAVLFHGIPMSSALCDEVNQPERV